MAGDDNTRPIECTVLKQTDNAVLVGFAQTGAELWVPRSCIGEDEDDIHSEVDELSIKVWWLHRNGL